MWYSHSKVNWNRCMLCNMFSIWEIVVIVFILYLFKVHDEHADVQMNFSTYTEFLGRIGTTKYKGDPIVLPIDILEWVLRLKICHTTSKSYYTNIWFTWIGLCELLVLEILYAFYAEIFWHQMRLLTKMNAMTRRRKGWEGTTSVKRRWWTTKLFHRKWHLFSKKSSISSIL